MEHDLFAVIASEEYQKEAKEYYQRDLSEQQVDESELQNALQKLGIQSETETLQKGSFGNVSCTFVLSDIVVKVSKEEERPRFLATKIISEFCDNNNLADLPIVHVIKYDLFQRTNLELLVMKRVPGRVWIETMLEMDEEERNTIFKQVLHTLGALADSFKFDSYGSLNDSTERFSTYADCLTARFEQHITSIRTKQLCAEEDVSRVEKYFYKHISVFSDPRSDPPVLVHDDIHMANIMHEGEKLTAIIDWDDAWRAPKVAMLHTIFGLIFNPQQFTEGTPLFTRYHNKSFRHLYPVLVEAFPDLFQDMRMLLAKMNLLAIESNIMWVSVDCGKEYSSGLVAHT